MAPGSVLALTDFAWGLQQDLIAPELRPTFLKPKEPQRGTMLQKTANHGKSFTTVVPPALPLTSFRGLLDCKRSEHRHGQDTCVTATGPKGQNMSWLRCRLLLSPWAHCEHIPREICSFLLPSASPLSTGMVNGSCQMLGP